MSYRLSERTARFLHPLRWDGDEPGEEPQVPAHREVYRSRREPCSVTEASLDWETHLVALEGDCDLSVAPQLARALSRVIANGKARIVVDVTAAEFVDVTILSTLLRTHRRVAELGGRLAVVAPTDALRAPFEAAGLDDVLALCASREDAIAAAAPAV